MINSFDGAYRFLSNFYPCEIRDERINYHSVECFYQAQKSSLREEKILISKMKSGEAKKYSHKILLPENWGKIKLPIMEKGLRIKFQDSFLRVKLISTGNEELIEGNYWNDVFWGVCKGIGHNHLGKLLMKIREEIKNGQF